MADNWVVSPILPSISKDIGVNVTSAALIITAYMLPFGLFQLIFGYLADRFGKRQVISFAMLFFTTEAMPRLNQDAVRLMKALYGIDMEKTQYSKLLSDIPPVDIVITMGCNVQCPFLPCRYREDWGLEDPTGKSDEEFVKVIRQIEENIKQMAFGSSAARFSVS